MAPAPAVSPAAGGVGDAIIDLVSSDDEDDSGAAAAAAAAAFKRRKIDADDAALRRRRALEAAEKRANQHKDHPTAGAGEDAME